MKGLLDILILLGSLQGVIIGTLLFFSKKNNHYANRLLAVFILLIAMACFNLYAQETPLTNDYPVIRWTLDLIPFVMAMPFGPLIYFYTKSVIDPSFRISKKQRWHFSTVLLDFVPPAIVWIFVIGVFTKLWSPQSGRGWGDFIDEYNAWSDIPRWLSLSIYVWVARKILFQSLKSASENEKSEYYWLKYFLNFVGIFLIVWFLFLIPYIIPDIRYQWLDKVGWYPLYIPMTVMVYWAGIRGYIQSRIAPFRKSPGAAFPKEVIDRTIESLHVAMNESKLYLDSGLTVAQLAGQLKIPPKTISGVLNQHLNKTFNEFVNEYRVAEVKRRLLLSENQHLTISGIALESGFNSQATFQRAFKSIAGISPSEFLDRQNSVRPVSV